MMGVLSCGVILIISIIVQVTKCDNVQTTEQDIIKAIHSLEDKLSGLIEAKLSHIESKLAAVIEDKMASVHSRINQMDVTLVEVKDNIAFIRGDMSGLGGRSSQALRASEKTFDELILMKQNVSQELQTLNVKVVSLEENISDKINDTSSSLQNIMISSGENVQKTTNLIQKIQNDTNSIKDPLNVIKNKVMYLEENTSDLLVNLQNNTQSIDTSVKNIENIVERLECSESEGFFKSPGSNQCLKAFVDQERSWEDAQAKCKSEGLALVKPYNVVELQSYLNQRYGDKDYWLGAQGTGSGVSWKRDGQHLPLSSALWRSGHPGTKVSTTHCLGMTAYDSNIKSEPGRPYYTGGCEYSNYALCEAIVE